LNDPSSDNGRQSSQDDSQARELSVDLMGFSASEDSDTSSDEDDEDSNGGAIVAYNTETMSNIMGTKVSRIDHPHTELARLSEPYLLLMVQVDTPPSPPSPPRSQPAVRLPSPFLHACYPCSPHPFCTILSPGGGPGDAEPSA
jgi:hypothetical protein